MLVSNMIDGQKPQVDMAAEQERKAVAGGPQRRYWADNMAGGDQGPGTPGDANWAAAAGSKPGKLVNAR
jgi:hypothetical protein